MTFEEILDQAVAMLQRRGRITYRALQAQFQLDDELLETLKDELLFSHPVVDENGRGLVWTGDTEATPVTTSQPGQPEPQPVVEQAQSIQATLPPVEPHMPDAERRQLTVMFCDLVDSTRLASQLDPEDYRDVVREYQRVCSEVITRFDGHIAQYLGDGLLVYFGYPVAHEEDAQRAVHSGLGIVAALKTLNLRLEQDKGMRLAVRLGIHTGLVVVGEMGGAGRQEQLALGEVPNVASRIQGIAQPDTVVMSAGTYRLVQGFFEYEPLGEYDLRGVSQPIAVYQVLQVSETQSRLDVASARGLTPLVGRDAEVNLLIDRWNQAKTSMGQIVLLNGEPGLGKSRLVQTLKAHLVNESHTRLECRSSPYYQNTALYPIIDLLQRMLRWEQGESADERLGKLEQALSQYRLSREETVLLMAGLLSLPLPEDKYPPLNLTPQRQRQKTLETIVALLLELAECQPVLFIVEDLHWTDPTTLEFIELLIDQTPTASLCVLLTCRPEFQPSWSHRSYLTEMTLNRLSQNQVERMAQQVAGGKRLPDEIIQQLVDKSDGVPLYVEEMTKAVLESGILKEANGHYELVGSIASLSIPATLQDSLMSRLDRLVTAKAVAQYAAVIGRQFTYELLQAVSELDDSTLQRELGRLVDAELVYQRGLPPQATYMFKHALIQDAAYESLLRSTRQGYHRRIAEVLTERFPEIADAQPERMAHHYTEAGLHERAVGYWHKAGEKAIQRSANVEAIAHLNKALELLNMLPDTSERALQELTFQRLVGVPLLATKGFAAPEVEHAYARARELCERVGDTQQVFPVLFGLWGFYHTAADLQTAREVAEQLLTPAQHQNDPALLLQGHRALGDTLIRMGEFVLACQHLEQGIELYDRHHHRSHALLYGQDPGMGCLGFAAIVLWMLGYPEQALQRRHEALSVAQDVAHPFSLAFALNLAGRLHTLRREWRLVQERAEAVIALSTEQSNSFHLTAGMTMRACALTMQYATEERVAHIRHAIAAQRATGSKGVFPWLALLAEAHGKIGQVKEGLTELTESLPLIDVTGERWYQAEVHRLKGEVLLSQSSDNQLKAETCFQKAITIAQHQQAKSWELRAATSLARLWQSQDKRQDAYDLLAPVYNWFTEGFDTADLQDAKALLDELS